MSPTCEGCPIPDPQQPPSWVKAKAALTPSSAQLSCGSLSKSASIGLGFLICEMGAHPDLRGYGRSLRSRVEMQCHRGSGPNNRPGPCSQAVFPPPRAATAQSHCWHLLPRCWRLMSTACPPKAAKVPPRSSHWCCQWAGGGGPTARPKDPLTLAQLLPSNCCC